MATALKKGPANSSKATDAPAGFAAVLAFLYASVDRTYRFLASLKLAVITLSSLAAVLAYATFFNAAYGTAAVDEWIYKSKEFAVLLAFLGANILCAALIRFPWKKRQTGFVITHAGLLVLLAGSWYGLMTQDEGVVAAMEGEVKDELVRRNYPVLRVRQVDPHNPDVPTREWEFPFQPGAFGWGPGNPRPRSVLANLNPLNLFDHEDRNRPREVLTKPNDPFQIVRKSHMPSSMPADQHIPDSSGVPMAKFRVYAKPPGSRSPMELFSLDQERWFVLDKSLYHIEKSESAETGEALPARFIFSYVDRPELVEDFLNPPSSGGELGTARFRYVDRAGKRQTYDWPVDRNEQKTVTLPESDLAVTFTGIKMLDPRELRVHRQLGVTPRPLAYFEVRQGDGAAMQFIGWPNLPMIPNSSPTERNEGRPADKPQIQINFVNPPIVDPKVNGLFGVVELLAAPEGALYYRVYGRARNGGRGEIRDKGPLTVGKEVVAFGGDKNSPMSLSFVVSEFLKAGIEKDVCEPLALPKGQMDNGLAASLVEMTVKDGDTEATREFYVRQSPTYNADWQTVVFPNAMYRIAYDVDRRPLGFELELEDFEVTFNPGTDQARSYVSKVLLTDKAEGIEKKPLVITMNEPITHRGYTFYQSSYIPETLPHSSRKTGRFQSVFQVGSDPARRVKYAGCLLVIVGAFVQFYMRAGLFTDGGKRERAKVAAKTAKAAANGKPIDEALLNDVESTAPAHGADVEEPL